MSTRARLPRARGVDHARRRSSEQIAAPARRRDDRAADAQHRPPPPGDPRRAAPARDARGRGRARPAADHRLRPHRHREDGRGQGLLEGDPRRSSGWTTSPTTSTRWPSAAPSRRCSSARCRTRAQYLRVIHLELNRIMSHLVWLGTSALDLGAISMFWYCFRERETILDLFEFSSGQRMHTRYFQVGGVIEDIPRGFEAKLREFLAIMPARADQYADLLRRNEILLQRLRGTCPLDEATLLALGVTGPLLRAAGNPWDLRKAAPYSSYERLRLQDPGRHRRRQLRPLRRPPGRDLRVGEDHRAGARRPARGPAHHRRTARSRCRRATSSRPRWRR